jgi:hypothetical protein
MVPVMFRAADSGAITMGRPQSINKSSISILGMKST